MVYNGRAMVVFGGVAVMARRVGAGIIGLTALFYGSKLFNNQVATSLTAKAED